MSEKGTKPSGCITVLQVFFWLWLASQVLGFLRQCNETPKERTKRVLQESRERESKRLKWRDDERPSSPNNIKYLKEEGLMPKDYDHDEVLRELKRRGYN